MSSNLGHGPLPSLQSNKPLKTGRILEVPMMTRIVPAMALAFGVTSVLYYAVRHFNTVPETLTPAFKAEASKIGDISTRTEAPPVFRNPISSGIPGYIRGPEDLNEEE